MAHELEIAADGSASFAYSGKIGSAWHRLGVEMEDLSTVEEILAAARADYIVHKDPLYAVDPTSDEGGYIDTGKHFTWRETHTVDEDGTPFETVKQCLGVVGSEYRTIQNSTAVELALELAGMSPDSPNIDCAGVLYDGRVFFATIPLPELVIDPKGIADRHGRNLVVVTGHAGNQSLELVNSYTRAVCANTVGAALRGSQQKIKIRHVATVDQAMVEAKSKLGLVLESDEQFQLIALNMLGMDSSWSELERIANKLWPLKDNANDRQKEYHSRRLNQIETIWNSDRGAGGVGENRYGVFQTLTEWMEWNQHIVGKSNVENRSLRAVDSPGFSQRVHKLGRVLQMKSPVKALSK